MAGAESSLNWQHHLKVLALKAGLDPSVGASRISVIGCSYGEVWTEAPAGLALDPLATDTSRS